MLNGVSAQRPTHSVFLGGEQLPLEARMGGIFLGFLSAVALVVVLGRLRASEPPRGALGLACWALVALTGIDGLNAFLSDGNLPHLYPPTTALRLLTGLGAGLAVGLMSVPVVSSVVLARPADEAAIGRRNQWSRQRRRRGTQGFPRHFVDSGEADAFEVEGDKYVAMSVA